MCLFVAVVAGNQEHIVVVAAVVVPVHGPSVVPWHTVSPVCGVLLDDSGTRPKRHCLSI